MPRCDHAAFRVADLDRSIRFYEKVLPAKLTSRVQREDRWRTEIATLLLLLIVGWSVTVFAHVLRHALSVPFVLGLVLAIVFYWISISVFQTVFRVEP